MKEVIEVKWGNKRRPHPEAGGQGEEAKEHGYMLVKDRGLGRHPPHTPVLSFLPQNYKKVITKKSLS